AITPTELVGAASEAGDLVARLERPRDEDPSSRAGAAENRDLHISKRAARTSGGRAREPWPRRYRARRSPQSRRGVCARRSSAGCRTPPAESPARGRRRCPSTGPERSPGPLREDRKVSSRSSRAVRPVIQTEDADGVESADLGPLVGRDAAHLLSNHRLSVRP